MGKEGDNLRIGGAVFMHIKITFVAPIAEASTICFAEITLEIGWPISEAQWVLLMAEVLYCKFQWFLFLCHLFLFLFPLSFVMALWVFISLYIVLLIKIIIQKKVKNMPWVSLEGNLKFIEDSTL
jgi:hypothetical protein